MVQEKEAECTKMVQEREAECTKMVQDKEDECAVIAARYRVLWRRNRVVGYTHKRTE